ncbi:glyoxalase/bleomycin resistance/extradiol dioxygenase family protein [Pigmentiphaga sp. NML080357]|uniref:VOC family protein n=1 Tax=Pigmentiphaga sp. NML080357 TaxID=2008675 RepID=UPI000B416FD3|nr:VOC family protein [Pigmentiphaga sp. NML080357]OVZ59409.1 glyoxalase/bleomycin resistance/extradiol dioxygenase family protein [Pigmentiphaga sp. NML080357]
MHKQMFVNFPVADLPRSKEFFGKLGFTFNPQFTNDQAACMVIGENLYAMLLTSEYFRSFINKEISDATRSTEVLVALSCESRAEVDDLVSKALAAGGTAPRPAQDHGFMYSHGFDDLDGHIWEVFYMDPSTVEQG